MSDRANDDLPTQADMIGALRERIAMLEGVVADYAAAYGLSEKARAAMVGYLARQERRGTLN